MLQSVPAQVLSEEASCGRSCRSHPNLVQGITGTSSHLAVSTLPAELIARLRDYAAVTVREKLCTRLEEMDVIAMSLNPPRPEIMFNTKLSVQFSRRRTPKLCRDNAVPEAVLEMCTPCRKVLDWPPSDTCHDVGGCFVCPRCNTRYTRKFTYETGSATYSIGRNPRQFRVLDFTEEMEEMVATWERQSGYVQEFNNIVLVMYCGSNMCAHCALGLQHGQIRCGSILGYHRDNGSGANSQLLSALNRTLNVGQTRVLSMEMYQHQGEATWHSVRETRKEFSCADGTEFLLDTTDENVTCRCTPSGDVLDHSAWFHGMQTPIEDAEVSCGYVARMVANVGDVRVSDDVVMHGVCNGPKQAAMDAVQDTWREKQCERYRAHVSPLVECALMSWRKRTRARARPSTFETAG